MNEIKVKLPLVKILALLAAVFLAFMAMNACSSVSQLDSSPVAQTIWMNTARDSFTFYDSTGRYIDDGIEYTYTFEQEKGWIQCTFDSGTPLIEMSRLQEDRLFCVTTNEMFYLINE